LQERLANYKTALRKYFPDIKLEMKFDVNYQLKDLVKIMHNFCSGKLATLSKHKRMHIARAFDETSFKKSAKYIMENNPDVDKQYASLWLMLLIYLRNDPVRHLYPLSTEQSDELLDNLATIESLWYREKCTIH
jgi:hypothetical protein